MFVPDIVRSTAVALLTFAAGSFAADTTYSVQELKMPHGIAPEIGGLGFTPSGKLVVLTRRSGILMAQPDADPAKFRWSTFSSQSLHNANGLLVLAENQMLVSQMPELTRITDRDGDGVADEYDTLAEFNLSGAYHEVTAGPVPDGQGGYFVALNTASFSGFTFTHTRGAFSDVGRRGRNFSSVPYRGWVMHLDRAGVLEPWAKGFRSPNGIALDPAGHLWVTDNQGDFRGTNPLYHVEKGKFYGHPSSLIWDPDYVKADPTRDPLKQPMEKLQHASTPAAVLFPYGFSRSVAQPIFDLTGGRFGPFAGQMFVADAAASRIIRVMLEEVGGVWQGACVEFVAGQGLRTGTNRMAFSPAGTELYVGQTMREWAGAMEGLQRIVFHGGRVFEILAVHLEKSGFEIEFTQPVDAAAKAGVSSESYEYAYDSSYGGKELRPLKQSPPAIEWSADRRKVHLAYPEIQASRTYRITLSGATSDKQALAHPTFIYTVNRTR